VKEAILRVVEQQEREIAHEAADGWKHDPK
jgi:hypothetical protein